MSGMWNRTLIYLGLREEPEEIYDELVERARAEEPVDEAPPAADRGRAYRAVGSRPDPAPTPAPMPAASRPAAPAEDEVVRPLRNGDVRMHPTAASATARAALVEVVAFEDVEAVGARYRTGQPVLFDVHGTDKDTARRVVDFVSGLTYALRGNLTKVGARAFLLVPDGLELPEDERRRLGDLGYRLPTGSNA